MDLDLFVFFVSKCIGILRWIEGFQDDVLVRVADHREMCRGKSGCRLISLRLSQDSLSRMFWRCKLSADLLILIVNLRSLIYFN